MALFMFVMGCVYVGSEQACQVAVYDYVYVYHGLCLCWVGASLPCCSLCLCLSWGVFMLGRSKLARLNYSSILGGIAKLHKNLYHIINISFHTGEAGDGEAPQEQEGVPLKWSGTFQGILAFLRTPFD